MRVFILPRNPPFGQFLDIGGEDFHYLARVRRVKAGDSFPGNDGRGGRWLCTVESIGASSLRLRLEQSETAPEPLQPSIHLIQCLPKAAKMDAIVRQATEAGVRRIVPVYSRHSQVRHRLEREMENRIERWRRIVRQAVQQSGACPAPIIDPPRELENVLRALGRPGEGEIRLYFHQDREGNQSLHRCLSKTTKIVTLVVGPEGGLSREEIDLLRKQNFAPVTVGRTVLRAETAALYAVAAVQTVIFEREEWEPT